MCETSKNKRPSLADARANWRKSDDPFIGKAIQVLGNILIKLRSRSDCCGHEGQVGC